MISPKNYKRMGASCFALTLLAGSAAASGLPQNLNQAMSQVKSSGGLVHKVQQQGQIQGQQQQQQRVQLRIINTLPVPVDYYVVNPSTGQPQRIGALQPGGAADLGSQPGLGWIFVQNQQQIQSYQTRGEVYQELRIAAPGQQQPPRLGNQFQPALNSQNAQQQGGAQRQQQQQQAQLQQNQQSGQTQRQQQYSQQSGQPQPLGQPQVFGQQQGGGQQQGFGQQQQLNQPQQFGQQQNGQQQQQLGQTQGQQPQQFGQNQGLNQNQGQPQRQASQPTEPPGLYQSSLTLEDCSVSYFTPGAPEIAICQYLGRLANSDPGAYQNYLASVQLRNNQSGGIQGQQQQQGFGTQNQGFGNSGGRFPAASSWGGIVRSGPSMQSDRLDSLSEGEVITLLADTGVQMNGYNWFQIQYRGGKSGYQWGGIICGQTQPIPGTFEICN